MTATLRRDINTGRAWLEFPTKPDAATCEALSAAGWRWSGYRKQWHHPRKHIAPPTGIAYTEAGTVDYSNERPERSAAGADRARAEASAAFQREHEIGDRIPMGQPILSGHHSERRHRRDIGRMQALATAGVEAHHAAERLDARAASSARLRERRETDPGLVERRLKKLRSQLAHMEAYLLRTENPDPDYVRRSHLVREEVQRNEALLAELVAAAGAPPEVHVGDVIGIKNDRFLVARVNHRTFSGWIIGGGADAWPSKLDRTHFNGEVFHRSNPALLAAVEHRTKLGGYYGDDKWRELIAKGTKP